LIPRGGEIKSKVDSINQAETNVSSVAREGTKQMQQAAAMSTTLEDPDLMHNNRLSWMSPKRLWTAARQVIDRTSCILRLNRSSVSTTEGDIQPEISQDVEFEELDSILYRSNAHDKQTSDEQLLDTTGWLESETSPPKEASLLKGWNQRSLRAWINKVSLI
jgi:hypothetical protein